MTEREFNKEMIAFYDEIKRIKASDKTMFAVEKPENLDSGAKKIWAEFKIIFEYTDPNAISEACDHLGKDAYDESFVNKNSDKVEFIAWLKNKISLLKNITGAFNTGDISEEEFRAEVEEMKQNFAK